MKQCGHVVIDRDGDEGPCERPASGWRWYAEGEGEHGPLLEAACPFHSNEGGRRLHAAESERDDLVLAVRELVDLLPHRSTNQPN